MQNFVDLSFIFCELLRHHAGMHVNAFSCERMCTNVTRSCLFMVHAFLPLRRAHNGHISFGAVSGSGVF